jgi:hypothetical protein
MGEVKPQDAESGLVRGRSNVRPAPGEPADLPEETLQGRRVKAVFRGKDGVRHQAAGIVRRDQQTDALMVKGWVDGGRGQTAVPRDAMVTVRPTFLKVELEPLPPPGHVQRTEGTRLPAAGSWADSIRQETPVTRDANVDVLPRR